VSDLPLILSGRAWKFGDDVDTDAMAPWNTLLKPWEERRAGVLSIRPEFAAGVRSGDLIVAGRSWGCGSSREQALENLRLLGVAAILAESFGRIYFRNAVATAFPHFVCPGIHAACEEGDIVEVEIDTARVSIPTRGLVLQGSPYAPEMLHILRKGGLLRVLAERGAASD
jgi:3-isopropylmalate/(R)-2-methylmalate dehydratase small subunit